jgi:hypothetical protein
MTGLLEVSGRAAAGFAASTGFRSSSRARTAVVDGRQQQPLAAHVGRSCTTLAVRTPRVASRSRWALASAWVAKPPSDRPGSSCAFDNGSNATPIWRSSPFLRLTWSASVYLPM